MAKHGIPLAAAELPFDGAERRSRDNRFDYGEQRMIARGFIAGRLFLCVFVDRGEMRRIVSLRKANRREMDAYRKGI